jgi:hypothetical protein
MLVAWSALAAAWNFYGASQLAKGLQPLGPTATVMGGVLALVLGAALVATSRRWSVVYMLLAAIAGLLAMITVVGAFTHDAALWPSDFWRYAGAILNIAGAVAAVMAIVGGLRNARY